MTDLEMTKLCAEAMGYEIQGEYGMRMRCSNAEEQTVTTNKSLQDEVRAIAESACTASNGQVGLVGVNLVESAIHQGIAAFAKQEPTMGQWDDFCAVHEVQFDKFIKAYKRMMAAIK